MATDAQLQVEHAAEYASTDAERLLVGIMRDLADMALALDVVVERLLALEERAAA